LCVNVNNSYLLYKSILLKDIIEDGFADRDKGYCIDANYHKGGNLKQYFEKSRRQLVFNNVEGKAPTLTTNKGEGSKITGLILAGHATDIKGHDSIKRVYSPEGKAPTLTTMGGGHREPKITAENCAGIYQRARGGNTGGLRNDGSKSTTLSSSKWEDNNHLINTSGSYRKLTPTECERLQTVPDNYTNHVSNSQRYKMLGNGWTVDIIAHIFQGLKPLL